MIKLDSKTTSLRMSDTPCATGSQRARAWAQQPIGVKIMSSKEVSRVKKCVFMEYVLSNSDLCYKHGVSRRFSMNQWARHRYNTDEHFKLDQLIKAGHFYYFIIQYIFVLVPTY